MTSGCILPKNGCMAQTVDPFSIGDFGDKRLNAVGRRIFKRVCEGFTACIKSLAGNRALEVSFGRFLGNKRVNVETISAELAKKTNDTCRGKKHVLCIQDTVQLTYPKQDIKKRNFGPTGDSGTKGLFMHPSVIVDAETRDVMGASNIVTWIRSGESSEKKQKRCIEEKESIRWIDSAVRSKEAIANAAMITIVGDRESDIFEVYERVPDERTHIIVRASHDRDLTCGEKISERLESAPIAGIHEIELERISGVRKKRTASLEIKHVTVKFEKDGEPIELNCVSAVEMSEVPEGESRISWVLLTTHEVNTLEDAIQILIWYTWRWIIEQIFRTMKNKGMKIEDSQIETPKKLMVMAAMGFAASIKAMSLVESRDGKSNRPASDLFSDEELVLLALICLKVQGKTEKQKNSYPEGTLSWAAWVIARLGGWNGYSSESPPGPITMLKGLQKFELQYEGWKLAQ